VQVSGEAGVVQTGQSAAEIRGGIMHERKSYQTLNTNPLVYYALPGRMTDAKQYTSLFDELPTEI
jgi:hypothetical protein